MVVIRFARGGRHDRAYFYIVVADSRSRRDGKFIETIGYYDVLSKKFMIDHDKLNKWIKCGAQMSMSVKNLSKKHKAVAASA